MLIFGYGSLIYKHNFKFVSKKVCYTPDYVRRFYQSSTDHREVESYPGRVVTLIKTTDLHLFNETEPTSSKCFGLVSK